MRQEEEAREATRQSRKLNFLITQTELYSHFVGSKMGMEMEMEMGGGGVNTNKHKKKVGGLQQQQSQQQQQQHYQEEEEEEEEEGEKVDDDLDFLNDSDEKIQERARRQAQDALEKQLEKTREFDTDSKRHKTASQEVELKQAVENLNFQEPSMLGEETVHISQPKMLMCKLKEYQLKGLNWLVNLYEQGINGILADEMGLGKTVQSISLMAYLVEKYGIWGPFMVVVPATTLHNWQQEISRFVPDVKILPYWGTQRDRKILRKSFWDVKKLGRRDSPFHVLITSYQLVVSDETVLNRVKWQYMVLDEAQAIKSSASTRWKVLLQFKCRNRLLLTGTPIQNSMQELWALLHFIMPSLFDSHEEFSEWFSKDIESHAETNSMLNFRQLQRLHMILKPFMLRRTKKHVQNELGEKIEHLVYCNLTHKQTEMYKGLMRRISVDDLLTRLNNNNYKSSKESDESLMNLVMQFRKVCNHPELFERGEIESPYALVNHSYAPLNRPESNWLYQKSSKPVLGLYLPNLISVTLAYQFKRARLFVDRFLSQSQSQSQSLSIFNNSYYSPYYTNLDLETQALSNLRLLLSVTSDLYQYSDLKSLNPMYKPSVIAPTPSLVTFTANPVLTNYNDNDNYNYNDNYINNAISTGCIKSTLKQQLHDMYHHTNFPNSFLTKGSSLVWTPSSEKLILHAGKMKVLDPLLSQLKADGHRVLIYFQMTRMIDLMEEYLAYRQYTYLRLDGSSKISDRNSMVMDWQTRPDIFIFLLSTRAGGLGINLTAADTVIFYDSDWNPTVDQQAMDRAHRLGQTKQVTVYRLITQGTIELRILERARQKDNIHKLVISAHKNNQLVSPNDNSESSSTSTNNNNNNNN
ncbi:putative DNA helicase ino80, partial [Zancudomyces culisetae]